MTYLTRKQKADELKARLDIVELAGALGLQVTKNGKQARCFNSTAHKHGDETPSLGFKSGNFFKCFACRVSGSVIDLYMGVRGLGFDQAVDELAEQYLMGGGVPLQPPVTRRVTPSAGEPPKLPQDKVGAILEDLLTFCGGLADDHLAYLKGNRRGLTDETIKRFRLTSIKDYGATSRYLTDKYSATELQAVGLFNDKENFVFFKHKLLIPYLQDGQAVYLKARRLDDSKPKYLNAGMETILFNLDDLLASNKTDPIYITEGEFDCMVLVQNGFKAVGVAGVTNFKDEYADYFTGRTCFICYDNDAGGIATANELFADLSPICKQVLIKQLPDGIKDITDYFLS